MSKKFRILLAVMAMALAVIALSACNALGQLTPLEQMQQKYGEIVSAKEIVQEITIMQGNMLQYESEKTFTRVGAGYRGTGYNVTGTERILNDTNSDKLYTEKAVHYELTTAKNVAPTLKLSESYFEDGYTISATSLAATVKQANIKDVFTLTDSDLTAPTDNLRLELSAPGSQLSTVTITYTSGSSTVYITLRMTY